VVIDLVLETGIACGIGRRQVVDLDRGAVRHDDSLPHQQRARSLRRYFRPSRPRKTPTERNGPAASISWPVAQHKDPWVVTSGSATPPTSEPMIATAQPATPLEAAITLALLKTAGA
jgi:hypothetical protein